jgi:hypothetical protein
MKILTDKEIIKKHDPSVRGRAYIELQIVNKLIEAAKDARYTLKVWDGYEEEGITMSRRLFLTSTLPMWRCMTAIGI